MNAATDALLFTQTFTNLAEEAGLGTCFLGTTVYMPKMIIDTLKLPKLVMPVATLTIGWPAEHPALSDRLLCAASSTTSISRIIPQRRLTTSMLRRKLLKKTRSSFASTT